MTGVLMQLDYNKIIFVATDAQKLVKHSFAGINSELSDSFIVPKKSLSLVKNVLQSDEEVVVAYNTKNVYFTSGETKVISAQDIDFANEADEVLDCKYNGDPISISFSAKFLIEMLSIIGSDDVELLLDGPSRAGILVPKEQNEGQDLLMLVMPVMVAY